MAEKYTNENVELGFLEETHHSSLLSHYFPSKVGGKPSWLSLSNLPTPDELTCTKCGKICILLLQVYSPNENLSCAFHRTIFVFICPNANCSESNCGKNFYVFRSQLPRKNDFYSSEPPKEGVAVCGPTPAVDLCVICGTSGPKKCSKCHKASYCSKDHQIVDWKNGHKEQCAGEDTSRKVGNILFPEAELVTEPEEWNVEELDKSDTEKWKEYEDFMTSEKATSVLKDNEAELEKMAFSEKQDDKVFRQFKERIKCEPDQVLRYQKGGEPLWVSSNHIPQDQDIPNCSCGAARRFEFQVMPQLLVHLGVDSVQGSIDWGTLCVYTCSMDCEIGNTYHREFLWKQDYS